MGDQCNQCAENTYATFTPSMAGCADCACNQYGSMGSSCDSQSGQCSCRSNVQGRACDACIPFHFGLNSSQGCSSCNCNPARSTSNACDVITGDCACITGAGGRTCGECLPGFMPSADGGCQGVRESVSVNFIYLISLAFLKKSMLFFTYI